MTFPSALSRGPATRRVMEVWWHILRLSVGEAARVSEVHKPRCSIPPIMLAVKRARRGVGNWGLQTLVGKPCGHPRSSNVPSVIVETEVLGHVCSQAGSRRGSPHILDVEVVRCAPVQLFTEAQASRPARRTRVMGVMGTEHVMASPTRQSHWPVQRRQW